MDDPCILCDDTCSTRDQKKPQAYTANMASPLGQSSFGHGMKAADRPSRGTGRAIASDLTKSRPKPQLKKVLPEVWKLVKPRRVLLGGSFLLMIINRASGLVLPASTRYLIDNVMGKHQLYVLPWIVGTVAVATLIQGITSYTLTQLLSKEGQRLIAELRMKVQSHVGRLPVAFYDENRTGTLVARIMTDVEGVRNLVGTGLLEFVGGVLTAIIAFSILIIILIFTFLIFFISILFLLHLHLLLLFHVSFYNFLWNLISIFIIELLFIITHFFLLVFLSIVFLLLHL